MKIIHLIPCLALALTPLTWAQQRAPEAPGMLGVHLHEIYPEDVDTLKLPGEYGAMVDDVVEGSAAAGAGLALDDVIVAYNGERVESARALQRMVRETPAGRKVKLEVVRAKEHKILYAELQAAPPPRMPGFHGDAGDKPRVDDMDRFLETHPWMRKGGPGAVDAPKPRRLGVMVLPVDAGLAEYLNLKPGQGLMIGEVGDESPAAKAGLQARDIILSVDDIEVTSAGDITSHLDNMLDDDVVLQVIRSGKNLELKVAFAPRKPKPEDEGDML